MTRPATPLPVATSPVATLGARLDDIRNRLARHAGMTVETGADGGFPADRLGLLTGALGLSAFERDVVVLTAACELDARIPALCAAAQPDPSRNYATFGLALAVLPEAHWSALTPAAPLRGLALLDVDDRTGLTAGRLRIDERILHLLVGADCLDAHLGRALDPVTAVTTPLPPVHATAVAAAADLWRRTSGRVPVVLRGPEQDTRTSVVRNLARVLGAPRCWCVPATGELTDDLARRLARESALDGSPIVLELDDTDPATLDRTLRAAARLAATARHLVLSCRDAPPRLPERAVTLDLPAAPYAERLSVWRAALGPRAADLNGQVERMAGQFRLPGAAVAASVEESELLGGELWDTCRARARADLGGLAERVEPSAGWNDLVLAENELATLHDVVRHARHRATVYESWHAAGPGVRGSGVTALFAGPSGTGKSLAAEVIAGELDVDLYRVDLSQVVSKYIGETEKNLRRVFTAAERGGAVLVFDEADALFGKRSEVKDSHDRYANIEVSYLLQRMEAYQGLAVLTTNLRSAIDQAFVRRLNFIVTFAFPDTAQRERLWRQAFGTAVPVGDVLPQRLAQLHLAGGNIRNVAVHAAFLAAERDGEVGMPDLLRAARAEYDKLERPLTPAELAGWPA